MIKNAILLILSIMIYIIEWKDIKDLNNSDSTVSGNIKAVLSLVFGCLGLVVSISNFIL